MTGTDVYYTHIKAKYLSGLVVSTGSLKGSDGVAIKNDAYTTLTTDTGATYYFPLYDTKV